MSLARIALRVAAVEAIRNRTLVGNNVLDTPNGALDIQADGTLRTDAERPFVAVYTDQGKVDASKVVGRSLSENGLCDIVFDIGISSAMLETNEDTGETAIVGINIPASDRGSEFFLDIVQRQICDVLTDPKNDWADIYRGLHLSVAGYTFSGARSTEDGQKIAGRQLRITVDLIDDPRMGQVLDTRSALSRALVSMENSADVVYRRQAEAMRATLDANDESWDATQRRLGLTSSELLSLGLGPLAQDEDRAAPATTAVVIEQAGTLPVSVED